MSEYVSSNRNSYLLADLQKEVESLRAENLNLRRQVESYKMMAEGIKHDLEQYFKSYVKKHPK